MVELHFERLPALLPCYLRVLVSGRSAGHFTAADIPEVRATTGPLTVSASQLNRFRDLLRYPDDGMLPPTFPQVIAAPLQLSILAAKDFPLRSFGLVHVSNTIRYEKAISPDQPLELAAAVSGASKTARGIEFSLDTTASVDGKVHWRAAAQLLARSGGRRGPRSRMSRQKPAHAVELDQWRAGHDIGRRYAAVSGDYNPIHLHKLTARAFGFKAPIAHGMWSLARSLTGLHETLTLPYAVEVDFLRPLLLPRNVRLLRSDQALTTFSLVDHLTEKPYLSGSIGRSDLAGHNLS